MQAAIRFYLASLRELHQNWIRVIISGFKRNSKRSHSRAPTTSARASISSSVTTKSTAQRSCARCVNSVLPLKKTPVAPQRDREDVAAARAQFLNEQRTLPAENLIFIDESGCHPGIGPRRGWSLKGKPLFGPEQVYARKQHVSIIGAISLDGLIAKATLRGGVGSGQFYRFVERQLVPVLRPGPSTNLHPQMSKDTSDIAGTMPDVNSGLGVERINEGLFRDAKPISRPLGMNVQ